MEFCEILQREISLLHLQIVPCPAWGWAFNAGTRPLISSKWPDSYFSNIYVPSSALPGRDVNTQRLYRIFWPQH